MLAFSLTLAGLRRTPTSIVATLALIEPLGVACRGIFFLGERLNPHQTAGTRILFTGVILKTLGKKRRNLRNKKICAPSNTIRMRCAGIDIATHDAPSRHLRTGKKFSARRHRSAYPGGDRNALFLFEMLRKICSMRILGSVG